MAGEIEFNFPESVVKEIGDYFFTLGHFGFEDISILKLVENGLWYIYPGCLRVKHCEK